MRVKDLLEKLKDVDPNAILSNVRYIDILPYYYDGFGEEIIYDEDGDNEIIKYVKNDKIYIYTYSLYDLACECDCEYERASKRIIFESCFTENQKNIILSKLKDYCDKYKKQLKNNEDKK